jgi:hypothetical protein
LTRSNLVGEQMNEVLTEMADWPIIEVELQIKKIKRPAIPVQEWLGIERKNIL